MTKEQILAMKPGTDLNLKVAEELMGHAVIMDETLGWLERPIDLENGSIWGPLLPYSEDTGVAEVVVARMIDLGFNNAVYWADFGSAEAICKSALLAMLERRRIEKVSNEILKQALGDEQ